MRVILFVTIYILFSNVVIAQLQGGTPVPTGQFEAIGSFTSSVGGCTATLITQRLVLTAAHCVCTGQTTPTDCVSRASFQFINVFPVDVPDTPVNESASRRNLTIQGDVLVYPQYTVGGWLRNDYAILRLDQRADQIVVGVPPIPVERPDKIPKVGETITLFGFGRTGQNCTSPGLGKMRVNVQVSNVGDTGIIFNNTSIFSCPGDFGGPALNLAGNVVGVASNGDFTSNSNYNPTYTAYEWIFGTGRILRAIGRLTLLRVHDVGTMYGPPTDPIDGEVVIQLDSNADSAYGFQLRNGVGEADHRRMLGILRDAFARNLTVHIEYEVTGPNNGRILRVIRVP